MWSKPPVNDTDYLANPVAYDQNGTYFSTLVWAGTRSDGRRPFLIVGQGLGEWTTMPTGAIWGPFLGSSTAVNQRWLVKASLYGDLNPPTMLYPLYALSSPITVVPEPSTFALVCVGAISLLGYAWRRQKRAA